MEERLGYVNVVVEIKKLLAQKNYKMAIQKAVDV